MAEADRPRVFVARVIPEVGLEAVRGACDMDLWDGELPPHGTSCCDGSRAVTAS